MFPLLLGEKPSLQSKSLVISEFKIKRKPNDLHKPSS